MTTTTITQEQYDKMLEARDVRYSVNKMLAAAGITVEPEKITLEHREGEYLHLSSQYKKKSPEGHFWSFASGIWCSSTEPGVEVACEEAEVFLTEFDVVSHGFLAPAPESRKVKWPKGTHITVKMGGGQDVKTRVLDEGVFEGDTHLVYSFTTGRGITYPRQYGVTWEFERVYVVGDTLPAGEPMPANGSVEFSYESRTYVKKGFVWRYDVKILWLEDAK